MTSFTCGNNTNALIREALPTLAGGLHTRDVYVETRQGAIPLRSSPQ